MFSVLKLNANYLLNDIIKQLSFNQVVALFLYLEKHYPCVVVYNRLLTLYISLQIPPNRVM